MWNEIKAWFKRRFGKKKKSHMVIIHALRPDYSLQNQVKDLKHDEDKKIIEEAEEKYGAKITQVEIIRKIPVITEKEEENERIAALKDIWGIPKIKKRKTTDKFKSPKASQHTKRISKLMQGKGAKKHKSYRKTELSHKKISEVEDD